MLNLIRNTVNNFRTSKATQDSNAFLAAAGITGQVQSQAIYNLVNDLQASGLWSKMKAVYPMVTDNYNLFSYSEDFTNASWQKSGITAIGDTTTAPNSTLTADTLQNSNTGGYVKQANLILSAGQYTQSCYFKKNNNNWVAIYTSDGGANYAIAYFNVNAGVVGTVSANGNFSSASSSIQNAGNGWYRCSLTFTKPTTGTTEVSTIVPDADNSFSRTVGQNTFAWGAQLENGGTLSTYQPIATTPSAFMASQMKYNLKDPRDLDAAFRLTWSGGWTYSATGATPNGTNGWANTNLNPVGLINGTNSHMSYYSRTDSDGLYADLGHGGAMELLTRLGNVYYADYPDSTRALTANASSLGNFIISNTSADGKKVFKNASTLISSAFVNANFSGVYTVVISNYNNLVPARYSNRQFSFVTIGDGLTNQDALLLNQIVEKYQVALSRGVQAAQSFYYNSAYSNEANTYLYSTQITGTTQVSAINTLINGLKANNLWTKMKAVYPFVTDKTLQADMAAQMKFNLVNPQDTDAAFRLAFSGGWTYSTNGAQPNGTNGYADTKLVLSSAISSQNSTHLSYYINQNAKIQAFQMGVRGNNATDTFIGARFSSTQNYNNVNSSVVTLNTETNNVSGMLLVSRTSSANFKYYKNSSLYQTNSTTSSSLPDVFSIYLGTINLIGSTLYPDNTRTAFATIGDGLTDAEAALLYSLVQQYQTDLTRQV